MTDRHASFPSLRHIFGRCVHQAYLPSFDCYLLGFDNGRNSPSPIIPSNENNEPQQKTILLACRTAKDGSSNLTRTIPEFEIISTARSKKDLSLKFHDICESIGPDSSEYLQSLLNEDRQCDAVYRWENGLLGSWENKITLRKARSLSAKISHFLGVSPPDVQHQDEEKNYSEYAGGVIKLRKLSIQHILHEMGHMLIEKTEVGGVETYMLHSSPYVWKMTVLYHLGASIPMDYLVTTAQHYALLGDTRFTRKFSPGSFAKLPQ